MKKMQEVILEEMLKNNFSVEVWDPGEHKYYGASSRAICLFNEINRQSTSLIVSQLLHLSEQEHEGPITLYLNTEGGSFSDALSIYDTIKNIPSPVVVIATGLCASAGLLVLSAADYRFATENTIFFYHQPVVAKALVNNCNDMIEFSNHYSYCQQKTDKILRSRAKMLKKAWRDTFENKTSFYFDAEEALSFGFIDKIYPSSKLEYTIEEIVPKKEVGE